MGRERGTMRRKMEEHLHTGLKMQWWKALPFCHRHTQMKQHQTLQLMGTAEGSSHCSQKRSTLTLLWTTTLPCSNTAAARLPTNIPSSPAVPQELPHTFCFIVNNSSKMINAKLGFVVILRRNIVGVKLVLGVQLVQHGGICTLCMHEKI